MKPLILYSVCIALCFVSNFEVSARNFTVYQGCSIFTVRVDVESPLSTSRPLYHVIQLDECMQRCLTHVDCVAFDYHPIRRPQQPHCRLQLDPMYLLRRVESPGSEQWELTSRCDIALNDPDDCRSDPCQNHGLCEDRPGSFACHCQSHYGGPLCERHQACDSTPCLNDGTCITLERGRYSCNCTEYVYNPRQNCQGRRPCESSPCLNEGNCSEVRYMGLLGYTCDCDDAYDGSHCQGNASAAIAGGMTSNEIQISTSVWVVTTFGVLLMMIAGTLAIYAFREYHNSTKVPNRVGSEDVLNRVIKKSIYGRL